MNSPETSIPPDLFGQPATAPAAPDKRACEAGACEAGQVRFLTRLFSAVSMAGCQELHVWLLAAWYSTASTAAWDAVSSFASRRIMPLRAGVGPCARRSTRVDPMLWLFKAMALLGVIGMPIVIFRAIWVWRGRMWWGVKFQATAIALACIAFSWFLISANLLKFSVKY